MDFCNELKKIGELYEENDKIINLLSTLSNIGVIAGGSVVYSLNDFVPKDSVGDIDLFVNSKDKMLESVDLIHKKFPKCEFNVHDVYNIQGIISMVTIDIYENSSHPIQVILYDFESIEDDLLDLFDIDYVQCGIHKNKVIITKRCEESHRERKILKISSNVKRHRLEKATLKNFQCIIFETIDNDYTILPTINISLEDFLNLNLNFLRKNEYFERDYSKKMILTDSIYISHIEVVKRPHCNVEELHDTDTNGCKRFDTCSYMTFEDEEGLEGTTKISSFSHRVDILNICRDTNRIFIKDDSFFNSNLLRYNDECFSSIDSLDVGSKIFLITPYYKNLIHDTLRGIVKNYKHYNENNILPIHALYNYQVIGHNFEFKNLMIKSAKRNRNRIN